MNSLDEPLIDVPKEDDEISRFVENHRFVKQILPRKETILCVHLPLAFLVCYGFNQISETYCFTFHYLIVFIIGLTFSCQTGFSRILAFYFSIFLFFHLLYKFNRFKLECSIMGSIKNCSWDRVTNSTTRTNSCLRILDYSASGISVPWIGLVAETITDVVLGIGKTLFVFIKDYDGKEIVHLFGAAGSGSFLTILIQKLYKRFNL